MPRQWEETGKQTPLVTFIIVLYCNLSNRCQRIGTWGPSKKPHVPHKHTSATVTTSPGTLNTYRSKSHLPPPKISV